VTFVAIRSVGVGPGVKMDSQRSEMKVAIVFVVVARRAAGFVFGSLLSLVGARILSGEVLCMWRQREKSFSRYARDYGQENRVRGW